jgi:hypothetical protein
VEGLEWVAVAMSDRVLMRAIEAIAVKGLQRELARG